MHFAFCIVHREWTVHCALCIVHCALGIALCTVLCAFCIVHCALCIVRCAVGSHFGSMPRCTRVHVHFALCSVHRSLYVVQCVAIRQKQYHHSGPHGTPLSRSSCILCALLSRVDSSLPEPVLLEQRRHTPATHTQWLIGSLYQGLIRSL